MELNIKEKIQEMYSFKQRSDEAFLRWKVNLPLDEAIEVVRKIGQMYVSNFVIDKDNEFVYKNLILWVNGDESMQAINPSKPNEFVKGNRKAGIYLAGPTGSGKTLCLEIIKAYATVVGAKMQIYPDEPKVLSWTSKHSNEIVQSYLNSGTMSEDGLKDVLCIEDFGCEPESVSFMGNKTDIMSRMIEYRGDYSNLVTLITTNLPIYAEITSQRYGSRVLSRLAKLNYFELKGKDRRK